MSKKGKGISFQAGFRVSACRLLGFGVPRFGVGWSGATECLGVWFWGRSEFTIRYIETRPFGSTVAAYTATKSFCCIYIYIYIYIHTYRDDLFDVQNDCAIFVCPTSSLWEVLARHSATLRTRERAHAKTRSKLFCAVSRGSYNKVNLIVIFWRFAIRGGVLTIRLRGIGSHILVHRHIMS